MHILYLCQSLGTQNSVVGDTVDRIQHLASHSEVSHISILALRGDPIPSIPKSSYYCLKRERQGRLRAFLSFIKTVAQVNQKNRIDLCYLYMTPTLASFLSLLKPFFSYKIVCWFAHTRFTWWTRLNLKFFSDLWVSVDKAQTFPVKHLKIIGQGVDLEHFRPEKLVKKYDLITVGRVTPCKNLELMLQTLHLLKEKYRKVPSLCLCGDAYLESDRQYKKSIEKMSKELGLEKQVIWAGSIERRDLPAYLNSSRFFLFTVAGGVGKATMEAMAVGLPCLISYPEAKDFFPSGLGDRMICQSSAQDLAKKYLELDQLTQTEEKVFSQEIVSFVRQNHSFESFTARLVQELKEVIKS